MGKVVGITLIGWLHYSILPITVELLCRDRDYSKREHTNRTEQKPPQTPPTQNSNRYKVESVE